MYKGSLAETAYADFTTRRFANKPCEWRCICPISKGHQESQSSASALRCMLCFRPITDVSGAITCDTNERYRSVVLLARAVFFIDS
ncbi:hypothetical protein Hypma_005170 [Hypsizygus marmoreus]|uniref:Uncharacterized protein n=1 Tax=Hypsizygus marmoreus TaxID=39966 RepID=A0A369K316_HYPMA|nr:hypothetical protein Hypma_005170 [Hypsizygus marmoreus]